MYRVVLTTNYEKEANKLLSAREKNACRKFFEELKNNPYRGKPLNPNHLREKKINNKRIYFLIMQNLKTIYIMTASSKKYQQKTIEKIRKKLKN